MEERPEPGDSGSFSFLVGELVRDCPAGCRLIQVEKNDPIYRLGDEADAVFIIESGQVKLTVPVAKRQVGLVAILAEGDLVGESCLDGQPTRQETAFAMKNSTLLRIPGDLFFATLQKSASLELMARYMSRRVEEQRHLIGALLAVKKQNRLALTLLYLAAKFGKKDPNGIRIPRRILQEDLAEMTGIRRPRVNALLKKLRLLGLLETNSMHQLVIRDEELTDYLEERANGFRNPSQSQHRYIN